MILGTNQIMILIVSQSRSDVRPSFSDRHRYHSQDNRRQPRTFSRSDFPDRQPRIICPYCHRSGHTWKNCFSRHNDEAARSRYNFLGLQHFQAPQQFQGQYPLQQFAPTFQPPRREQGHFSSQQHFQ